MHPNGCIAALFTISMTWKQHKCPWTEEQIENMWCVCVCVCVCVHTQWNIIQPLKEWNNAICCNMDGPREYHTEWNKSEKILYDIPYMWNLKRNDTNELKKQRLTDLLNLRLLGERDGEFGINIYTLLYLKWITNKDLLNSTWNSAQCCVAAWMGGEFGGEWIHVYVWLNPFTVDLKLSQYC